MERESSKGGLEGEGEASKVGRKLREWSVLYIMDSSERIDRQI